MTILIKSLIDNFIDDFIEFIFQCTFQHHRRLMNSPVKFCKLTLREFSIATGDMTKQGYDKWLYCDYKHMTEFSDKREIIESFNWLKFGIDKEFGKNGLHSTIWIGSKGAHTDCHWDTYGYNLVAQIHGRFVYKYSCSINL